MSEAANSFRVGCMIGVYSLLIGWSSERYTRSIKLLRTLTISFLPFTAMNTPYFVGSITAIVLNLLIPTDLVDDTEVETEMAWLQEDEEEDIVEDEEVAVTKNQASMEADMTEREEVGVPKEEEEEIQA